MSSWDVVDTKYQPQAVELAEKHPKSPDDEGAQVLAAAEDTSPITEHEERQVLTKTDWRIMPVLWIVFGMQCELRSLLSPARLHRS